jgi:hypothetical protein
MSQLAHKSQGTKHIQLAFIGPLSRLGALYKDIYRTYLCRVRDINTIDLIDDIPFIQTRFFGIRIFFYLQFQYAHQIKTQNKEIRTYSTVTRQDHHKTGFL